MKYLPFLLILSACSFESENLNQNTTESQVKPTSHSTYLDTREKEPDYSFVWSDQLSRINDSTIAPVMKLLENRYDEEHPDFALLDWNNDGFEDLFFEYYASAGTGVKFRVDVYEFDPKTKRYLEEDYSFMNPAFYYDRGIITSHYWGNDGGYGAKYKVHNGTIDTLETIDIDIMPYRPGPIKEVNYIYSQYPFKDSIYVSDTLVQLPSEYQYYKIIKTDAGNCDFESVNKLNKFSYHFNDILNTKDLIKVPSEQIEFLFDYSTHPSPQTSFFVGKFEIGTRIGLVTYNEYKNAIGKVFHFFQIHILEGCSNLFTEYLALDDSELKIYQIQSQLSLDFTQLEITRIHSNFREVEDVEPYPDTLYTEIYTLDLTSSEFNESLKDKEVELIDY